MTKDEWRDKIIKIHTERGDFVKDVDGYVKYWPEESGGYLESFDLRCIADELDRLNEPWQKQINEYFDNLALEESAEAYKF